MVVQIHPMDTTRILIIRTATLLIPAAIPTVNLTALIQQIMQTMTVLTQQTKTAALKHLLMVAIVR